uniref:Uncharacterized protein n=1 Tax=Oryza rufipogon TaxID=4529 RepID=A0A0E0P6C4_ORYRU
MPALLQTWEEEGKEKKGKEGSRGNRGFRSSVGSEYVWGSTDLFLNRVMPLRNATRVHLAIGEGNFGI